MRKTRRAISLSCGALVAAMEFATPALAWNAPLWIRQVFATPNNDYAHGVATDEDGDIYVVGDTVVDSSKGREFHPWVIKFGAAGDKLWARQFASEPYDRASVATDENGSVYIAGITYGSLEPNHGGHSWVAKLDAEGHSLWLRQFGETLFASTVAIDKRGNLFIGGSTSLEQAFAAKLDGAGHMLWTREFGGPSPDVTVSRVTADGGGNVYVAGTTAHTENGEERSGWVTKFGPEGVRLWTQSFSGGDADSANSVASDKNGDVYVAGDTDGSLFAPNPNWGTTDAWVIKFDDNGNRLWARQFGTDQNDGAQGLAIDKDGNVYLVGATTGALAGVNRGSEDAWVAEYSPDGRLRWKAQLGRAGDDSAADVAVGGKRSVYIAGFTNGPLCSKPNRGGYDAFVAKYSDPRR